MNTAERLIESTRELLWDRGYTATSPKAILQRAGVGQGSMYHHFTGKADLALAAIRCSAEEVKEEAEQRLSSSGTSLDRIASYSAGASDVLRGCPVGRLTADPEIVDDDRMRQPVEETFAWLQQRLTAVLSEGQEGKDEGDALDPADTAAAILAVVQGGYVLARASGSAASFDQAVNGLLSMLNRLAA
ncbi:TetR/AcrR family transcriptional regulator [Streptomyces sp. B1I3]|uniref:TetR/AcrR family transcriptional regulator n=1 Tax=Streptomyces sp. B1I3 TaxID=3042264 RepID=UPI0027D78989|nr:TetR/AcrR family transcriptional regulator [Streptomyces sp. B1I3]